MSTMWKSTFREIKQSFGRFFAIMAVCGIESNKIVYGEDYR